MRSLLLTSVLTLVLLGCSSPNTSWSPDTNHPGHSGAESTPNPSGNVALAADHEHDSHMHLAHESHIASPSNAHQHDDPAVSTSSTDMPMHAEHHPTVTAESAHDHSTHAEAGAPFGEAADRAKIDGLFTAYLELTAFLAADNAEEAGKRLDALHRLGHDLSAALDERVASIGDQVGRAAHEDAPTIELMRERLKAVSPAVIELVKIAPPNSSVVPVVREAYCPMAEASWLQTAVTVTNPYYGSQMLDCGSITATYGSAATGHEEHEH